MDDEESSTRRAISEPEVGGDPACWAALVCPSCGALADMADAVRRVGTCPRCGEAYPVD